MKFNKQSHLKKSLWACTAITISMVAINSVYANGDTAPVTQAPIAAPVPAAAEKSDLQHGLYAGVAAGLRLDKHDMDTSVDNGVGSPVPILDNFDLTEESFTGGFQIGYGARFAKHFYVGLEGDILFGNMNDNRIDRVDRNQPEKKVLTEVKGTTRYGLAARLGGYWQQTLFYLRFGVEWERFKLRTTSSQISTDPGGTFLDLTLDKKYTKAAFTPGVGFETQLFDKASLGLEYRAALHSRNTETLPSPFPGILPLIVKHKPLVQSILIRFNYNLINFG